MVVQEQSTKLLGMTINENMTWKEHFYGKNGLISALNKRLFTIRRVSNHIPRYKLLQLAHALWMSKLRYGLQLCKNVRNLESEQKNTNMKSLQIAQNKLMRLLVKAPFLDRTTTSVQLNKTGLLSVNQTAACIKLTEVWKRINVQNYPIKLEPNKKSECTSERVLRPKSCREWNQDARTNAEKECFSRNAAKLWNKAPWDVVNAKTLATAKAAIKSYCKTLPI